MALVVETGVGVAGADSYAALTTISTYWTNRPHNPLAPIWADAVEAYQEGAAREATATLDAVYGPFYRGSRAGTVQGLLFPRFGAVDDAGWPLPALPPEIVIAVCELAPRALSARLVPDQALTGAIKSETKRVGPIQKTTEYANAAERLPRYGFIDTMLEPVLNGLQPMAPVMWNWR